MFWGLSEALDLYYEYMNAFKKPENPPNVEKSGVKNKAVNTGVEKESELETGNVSPEDVNTTELKQNDGNIEEGANNSSVNLENANMNNKKDAATSTELLENPTPPLADKELKQNEEQAKQVAANPTALLENSATAHADQKLKQNKEQAQEVADTAQELLENATTAIADEELKQNEELSKEEVGQNKNTTKDANTASDNLDNVEGLCDGPQTLNTTASQEDVHSIAPPEELHILLFGANDPRHVLLTMAKAYAHPLPDGSLPRLHFYMVDGCIEITARIIILLAIALENPQFFSVPAKTHLFMDVYGNALLRPSSHFYLVSKAKTLLKMVSDPDLMAKLAPMLNLDTLKYRERDGLQDAFNFWLNKPTHIFDITSYWETRNRHLLADRYDYRKGAFDWDLNMTLKDRQGKQICGQEYCYWRESGIAFTYPEYEQCKPNKTLSVGLIRNGPNYQHRGYVGDMQTGPFCAYGLKTEDVSMLNSAHGQNDYRATDITERNVHEIMHEIQTATPYVHDSEKSRKYGAIRLKMSKLLTATEDGGDDVESFAEPWINMKNIQIHFLAAEEIYKMQQPENRWKKRFDILFLGHNYLHFVKSPFGNILKPRAVLLMETKLMTVLRKEELTEFEHELKNVAKLNKFKPVINYNALNMKNSILKYKRTKKE